MRTMAIAAATAGTVAFGLLSAVPPAAAGEVRAGYGLAIRGTGNHRRPLPRETQLLRWTVTNTGTQAWRRVRLQVTVPADWRLRGAAGCRARGPRLTCDVNRLRAKARKRIVIRMAVPPRPRLGTVQIRATTRAWAGRAAFPGPSTSFPVTVVRSR